MSPLNKTTAPASPRPQGLALGEREPSAITSMASIVSAIRPSKSSAFSSPLGPIRLRIGATTAEVTAPASGSLGLVQGQRANGMTAVARVITFIGLA